MNIRGVAFLGAIGVMLSAQTPALQIGVMYVCGPNAGFKVTSCAGPGNGDACDVESQIPGQPNQRGKSPRGQVMALVSICHVQTPAEAQAGARGGVSAAPAGAQTGTGGFKVGDTVQVNTAFGWMDAKVLKVNGNQYFVHAQSGAEVWKPYPTELRRIGPIHAEDRANGLYELHDKVQVNVEGKWTEGEIIATLGQEYQVQLPGNRAAWATPQNLRFVAAKAAPPAGIKAGTPPKPGLTSCAGKIEGRYASSAGFGGATFVFRSGKVTITGPLVDPEEAECWMGGGKIILHKPGQNSEMDLPLDINKDGTLDTPFGEVKKKGD